MAEPRQVGVSLTLNDQMTSALQQIADTLDELLEAFTGFAETSQESLNTVSDILSEIDNGFEEFSEAVTTSLDAANDSLSDLDVNVDAMYQTMDDGSVATDALTEAMDGLATSTASAAVAQADLGTAVVDAGVEEEENATDSLGAASNAMYLLRHVVLLVGIAIGTLAVQGIEGAASFQTAMTKIQTLALGTEESIDPLYTAIESLASATGSDLTDSANALYYILSALPGSADQLTTAIATNNQQVIDSTSGMQALQIVMEGAVGSMMDANTYANLLTDTINAFQLNTGSASEQLSNFTLASNVMFAIVQNGKINMSDLTARFGILANTAYATGMSLQDMGAVFDTLINQSGGNASSALTKLSTVLNDLSLKSSTISNNAAKLGITFDEATYSSEGWYGQLSQLYSMGQQLVDSGVFPSIAVAIDKLIGKQNDGLVIFDLMTNNATALKTELEKLDAVTATSGNTELAYQAQLKTVSSEWDVMKTAVAEFWSTLLPVIQPTIANWLDGIANGFKNASDWVTKHKSAIQEVSNALFHMLLPALAAVGGYLLLSFGSIFTTWESKVNVFSKTFGEIGGLFKGFGALFAVGGPLAALWAFGSKLNITLLVAWISNVILNVGNFVQYLPTLLSGMWGKLVDLSLLGIDKLDKVFTLEFLQKLPSILAQGMKGFPAILESGVDAVASFAGSISAVLVPVLLIAGLIALIVIIFINFRTQFMAAIQPLESAAKPIFESIKKTILDFVSAVEKEWATMWPKIKPAVQQFLDAISRMGPVVQVVGGLIAIAFKMIMTALEWVVKAFLDALPTIINIFTRILNVITGVCKLILDIMHGNFSAALTDAKNIFTNLLGIATDIFKMLVIVITDLVIGLWNTLGILLGKIASTFGTIWGGIYNDVKRIWDNMHTMVLTAILDILNAVIKGGQDIAHGFVNAVANALVLIGIVLGNLKSAVTGFFSDAITWLEDAGKNIIKGLESGINAAKDDVVKAAQNVAGSVGDAVKNFFHIGSPSKLMQEYGVNVINGLALGMQQQTASAATTARTSSGQIVGGFSGLSGSQLSSGRSTTQSITVNLGGSLGAGLQLLNATDRRNLAMQLAKELSSAISLQANTGSGYTGTGGM